MIARDAPSTIRSRLSVPFLLFAVWMPGLARGLDGECDRTDERGVEGKRGGDELGREGNALVERRTQRHDDAFPGPDHSAADRDARRVDRDREIDELERELGDELVDELRELRV